MVVLWSVGNTVMYVPVYYGLTTIIQLVKLSLQVSKDKLKINVQNGEDTLTTESWILMAGIGNCDVFVSW